MKILWWGNAPFTPSGYGEQGALFVTRLQELGHELAVAANWGLQGATLNWNGVTVYPSDGMWGNDTIGTYIDHHGADLTIGLADAWVLNPGKWPDGTRVAVWAPVDHHPVPPRVYATLASDNVAPIAMSKFGEAQMRLLGLDPCYVPHGVETSVFRPQPEIRDQIRDALGIPREAFLVGMVAANKASPELTRKSFPQAFMAFQQFAQEHPDAWMYVHTEASAVQGGIDLDQLAVATQIPKGKLRFPPDADWHIGIDRHVVAALYQAFDVLLNPSMGEGFGIPIVEAQASGVPVIVSRHSAMTELCGAGWLVEGDPWWDALQSSFLIVPSVASILEGLENAYEARGDQKLREQAREFALDYDADLVAEKFWVPALERLTKPRVVPPLAAQNGNRAQRRAQAKKKLKVVS